jgi:hypothetical protein
MIREASRDLRKLPAQRHAAYPFGIMKRAGGTIAVVLISVTFVMLVSLRGNAQEALLRIVSPVSGDGGFLREAT